MEKRLMKVSEFCEYAGISDEKAREVIRTLGIGVVLGPRSLRVDVERFDAWCSRQNASSAARTRDVLRRDYR